MTEPADNAGRAIKVTSAGMKFLWFLIALFPAVFAPLVTPAVQIYGKSLPAVFLGTIALSGAVFLVTLLARHTTSIPWQGALLLVLGAVLLSSGIATALGQDTPVIAAQFQLHSLSPPGIVNFLFGFVAASFVLYGFLGGLLSIVSGVLYGWKVSQWVKQRQG